MTNARRPGGDRDDPLLRAVTEYWDEIQGLAGREQRDRLLGLLDGTIEPDPAEARAALADELLDLLPPDHPVIRVLRTGVAYRRPAARDLQLDLGRVTAEDASTVTVAIYLADERIHAQVEKAVEGLLATAGLYIEDRDDPVVGSWFRRMAAGTKEGLRSPSAHNATLASEPRLALAHDAEVTARLLQNLGPVLGALQPTKDAVIRVGALLIVKADWTVSTFQLTAPQQARLDQNPQLTRSPRQVAAALNLASGDEPERWDPSEVTQVRAEALDVLSDALLWQLAEPRWQAVEQILVALDAAVASGDIDALAAATADLELAGPLRIIPIGPPPAGPTPAARDLLNKLVHSLGGVTAARQEPEPQDTGAGDADASRS